MEQVISVLDDEGDWPMVREIFVQRVDRAREGMSDEARIAAALPKAERCLAALAAFFGDEQHLADAEVSIADAQAAPMSHSFVLAPEGRRLLRAQPSLQAWRSRVSGRASVAAACVPEVA